MGGAGGMGGMGGMGLEDLLSQVPLGLTNGFARRVAEVHKLFCIESEKPRVCMCSFTRRHKAQSFMHMSSLEGGTQSKWCRMQMQCKTTYNAMHTMM